MGIVVRRIDYESLRKQVEGKTVGIETINGVNVSVSSEIERKSDVIDSQSVHSPWIYGMMETFYRISFSKWANSSKWRVY